jgi:cation transport ATPase
MRGAGRADDQRPQPERVAAGGATNIRPRATLIILAVLALQCLAYIIRTAERLSRPSVGGAGLVLAILVCQFALYAILATGLWHAWRWAFFATAVVLVVETAWALLVSVNNHLYTPQFMTVMVLSVAALVALIPARARAEASAL